MLRGSPSAVNRRGRPHQGAGVAYLLESVIGGLSRIRTSFFPTGSTLRPKEPGALRASLAWPGSPPPYPLPESGLSTRRLHAFKTVWVLTLSRGRRHWRRIALHYNALEGD